MRKIISAIALALALAAAPAAVFAAQPETPSCWGAASADLAQSYAGAMGDHASSFDSPRLGIGNVAEAFTGTHQPGELAAVLGFSC